MGKGHKRRPTNEKAFCEHHEAVYGKKIEAPRSNRTKYVVRNGELVEKNGDELRWPSAPLAADRALDRQIEKFRADIDTVFLGARTAKG